MSESVNQKKMADAQAWPNYAAVWRWHFYAGIFCIPFVLVLSITGTIYLFKSQIEAWQERSYNHLPNSTNPRLPITQQVEAAIASLPNSKFVAVEQPTLQSQSNRTATATRVLVDRGGKAIRVYVDPTSNQVLGSVVEQDRFIRIVRRLHGELLIGKQGSYIVETAASWTIVMVLTGLALWMPKKFRAAGILYPRLNGRGKTFWKDIHSVGGFWLSGLILFLVATGLPWANFWGDYFKSIRKVTGTSNVVELWDHGNTEPVVAPGHEHHAALVKKAKGGGQAWRKSVPDPNLYSLTELNQAVQFAQTLDFLPPVSIAPSTEDASVWVIKSETANRPYQQTILYDVAKEEVIDHEKFSDRHWIDQAVGQGIALHEGQRFGWLNQAIALLTTFGLVLLSFTGLVLWLRRRNGPGLDSPAINSVDAKNYASISRGRLFALAVVVFGLGLYLPLFGITLFAVLLLDWILLSRVTTIAIWLGRKRAALVGLLLLSICVTGCSNSATPITGGTNGTLTSGGIALSQMQINVFSDTTAEPLGRGYVDAKGNFSLVDQRLEGPLVLQPGLYRFTVESLGAEVAIPREYTDPAKTPLKIDVIAGESLHLAMPLFRGVPKLDSAARKTFDPLSQENYSFNVSNDR